MKIRVSTVRGESRIHLQAENDAEEFQLEWLDARARVNNTPPVMFAKAEGEMTMSFSIDKGTAA